MSTVILKWNPGFSSYTMARFLKDLEKGALSNNGNVDMNWSVWDHELVHKRDICYLLKVGYGQTGIVARGIITSEAYPGEDWAWRNRPTMYCDFDFEVMINPDAYPLLDSKALSEVISDFDWHGGHSGIVLSNEQADALEDLWTNYMQRQTQYFNKVSDYNLFIKTTPDSSDTLPYAIELEDSYNGKNICLRFKDKDDINCIIRISNIDRIYGKFGVKSLRALRLLLLECHPSTESLQKLCSELFHNQIEFEVNFYKDLNDDDNDDDF